MDRRRALLAASAAQEEKEIVLRHEEYYPQLVDSLFEKYGENYGSRMNPLPFDGNILLEGFSGGVEGKVEYIHTDKPDRKFAIYLYPANYKDTYECAYLDGCNGYAGMSAL